VEDTPYPLGEHRLKAIKQEKKVSHLINLLLRGENK
jgi:hypothetical protein